MAKTPISKKKSPAVSNAVIIAALEKQAKPLQLKLAKLKDKVASKEDYELAAQVISDLKQLAKTAKFKEGEILTPIKQAEKATKELFSPFYNEVSTIETIWKDRMVKYVDSQRSKTKLLEAKVDSGKMSVGNYADKMQKLEDNVTVSAASNRTIKVLVIEDESKIPREFLVPDLTAIKVTLKEGRKVPGCKLEDKTTVAI